MHRKFGVVVAVAIGVTAVLATAGLAMRSAGSTTQAFPTEPVNLTMSWWGEQEAAGAKGWLAETVAAYQKKHPNVKIKTVLQTTDGLIPAFKAAAAAKKGPDIQYFWGGIWSLDDAWLGNTKPVSDYIPKSELAHYLNAKEDTYDGKVWTAPWYVQPSFPVLYRKDVLAKAGVAVPTSWAALLKSCDQLNAKGITPIAGGIKDGWFGGWLFSIIGAQGITLDQRRPRRDDREGEVHRPEARRLLDAPAGAARPQVLERRHQLADLYQGQEPWSRASGDDGLGRLGREEVRQAGRRRKARRDGDAQVGQWPVRRQARLDLADRRASRRGRRTPSISADFIMFMHTPERMAAWFKTTGAFPADNRFNTKLITLPQQKVLFNLVKNGSPYLENFIPPELDAKAFFAQAQLLLGGNTDAAKAAAATEKVAQRIRLDAAEADGELQDVVSLVPLGQVALPVSGVE